MSAPNGGRSAAIGQAWWNHGPDGLLVVAAGAVVEANQVAQGWLGDVAGAPLPEALGLTESELATATSAAVDAVGPERTLSVRLLPLDEQQLAVLRDVTPERRAAAELSQKRATLEDSLNGYDIVSAEGLFLYANRAYLDMWGYETLDEILGTSPAGHCADPEIPGQIIREVTANGRMTKEFVALRKDGTTFDVLMAVQLAQDACGETIYVGTSLDVSERRRLQAELFRLQKTEAIGNLAASVAHDFNNMLSPILGFTELTLNKGGLTEEQRAHLEYVQTAAERSRAFTAQLLAFSRKQALEPLPTDLTGAVRELEPLLRRVLRADVALTIHASDVPCRVLVDPAQLQQVLLNLALNAQDAMPQGGRLTVEVGQRVLEGPIEGRVDVNPGRFGEIVVSDTGEGMDAETLERVFEPFFSTKGPFGTGLGLASVLGIVKQHQGNVWAYSEPGVGTTFKVYLPLTDAVPAPLQPKQQPTEGGGGRILVVEDDDLVRVLVEQVLSGAGYTVTAVETAQEAEDALSQAPADLLLTDVILADTNGRALADQLRSRQPDLRVLFMSGYTDNVILHHGVLDTGVDLLHKPFNANELLRRVRAALNP